MQSSLFAPTVMRGQSGTATPGPLENSPPMSHHGRGSPVPSVFLTPSQVSGGGGSAYGGSSPPAHSSDLIIGDRFIASVEPSAFHGPESPTTATTAGGGGSRMRGGGNGSDAFASMEFEHQQQRTAFSSSLQGGRGTPLQGGADEESLRSYHRALKEQMGVQNSVMRYNSTPQQHSTPYQPPQGAATPGQSPKSVGASPYHSFSNAGATLGAGGGHHHTTLLLGTPIAMFPTVETSPSEASPGHDVCGTTSSSPGTAGFSTPRKRPVVSGGQGFGRLDGLQDSRTLGGGAEGHTTPPPHRQSTSTYDDAVSPGSVSHLMGSYGAGGFGSSGTLGGGSLGESSFGMLATGGGGVFGSSLVASPGARTPPQRGRPAAAGGGVSTSPQFRTPIAETSLLMGTTPIATPRSDLPSAGVVGSPAAVAGGGGFVSPGVSPFQSPAGGRLNLTATPLNNRTDASYHRRRRRLEGSTPLRILNADGISDQCGTSALSWTGSALFIALKNVLYAWTPESVDVVMEVPEPSITSVSGSDVTGHENRGQHSYVALGTENGLVHVLMMLQAGVPTPPSFMEGPDGQIIEDEEPPGRIQWHFMITEHMTRCTATDIHRDRLVTGSAEGILLLTDLRTHLTAHRLTVCSSIMCAKFSPRDGSHLAVGTDKGITLFRSSDFLEPITCYTEGPVKCLSWNPHGLLSILTYAVGSTVHFYSPGSGDKGCKDVRIDITSLEWAVASPELIIGHGAPTFPSVADADGLLVLQNSIGVYDGAETANDGGKLRLCSIISGHRAPSYHIAVEPRKGGSVVTGAGGEDNTLRFWALYPSPSGGTSPSATSPPSSGENDDGVELFPGAQRHRSGGSPQRSTYVDCYEEGLR